MTSALTLQGRIFCAVSLGLLVVMLGGVGSDPRQQLLAVGVLVLLLGVPHGALDVVVARRLFGALSLRSWTVFSLLYVGLAGVVVVVWYLLPALFLCGFLIFSALHFGGDRPTGASSLERVLYGGTVIVLPALWHGAELQHLLGLVAGPANAAFIVPVLSLFATPWLCATSVACIRTMKDSPPAAVEWVALVAVSVATPPLVAFTVYFCAMHSPRHMLRTLASLRGTEARNALKMALWPTVIVLAAAVLTVTLTSAISFESRMMQLIFVGLAALTLPHMALLERVRQVSISPKSTI